VPVGSVLLVAVLATCILLVWPLLHSIGTNSISLKRLLGVTVWRRQALQSSCLDTKSDVIIVC
jgi:hypothetical protein